MSPSSATSLHSPSRTARHATQSRASPGDAISPLERAYSLTYLGSSAEDNENLVEDSDRRAAADIELMDPRAGDGLLLTRGRWCWEVRKKTHYQLRGLVHFHNTTKKNEIFVPELEATAKLLAPMGLEGVSTRISVLPRHTDGEARPRQDGYWTSYIVKAKGFTTAEVVIDIELDQRSMTKLKDLSHLNSVLLKISYFSYGPHGRSHHAQRVVLPLQFPVVAKSSPAGGKGSNEKEREERLARTLSVNTHLLSHMDDPVDVVRSYVVPKAKEGDIIAIGETPLAIMQGRYRHPETVRPGIVAKLCCKAFHPTSSLATACGMQTLVDYHGALRVLFAFVVGVLARIFLRKRGVFYNLAGYQAPLIDDVTGTLPPYDQFICLGPKDPREVAERVKAETGFEAAIVDVNDLQVVKILASTDGASPEVVEDALRPNPAGNADQQTPLVIIRPKE